MPQAVFVHDGHAIDHTPSADVAAGQVVIVGKTVGVAKRDIESGELGALHLVGVYDVAKVTGAITDGADVYWDADADPVGGTAGTGALTTTASGNTFFGRAVKAAASGDSTVRVKLIQQAP